MKWTGSPTISKRRARNDRGRVMADDDLRELERLLTEEKKDDAKDNRANRLCLKGVVTWEPCANGLDQHTNGRFLLRLQSMRL